jgi:glutaredoxin
MKSFFVTLLLTCLLFIGKTTVSAADQVNLYFFFSLGCPHCAKETKFLNTQIEPLEDVVIHAFEVSQNQDNARLFSRVGTALGMSSSGVPVTIIGDWYTVGYGDDQTSGAQLLAAIDVARASGDPDLVGQLINPPAQPVAPVIPSPTPVAKPLLPSIGNLDLDKLSLPLLTVVIAAVDGFNPCAMWVLLFLISMLLGMQNRLKMWILGSVFILTSGVVYYFFLAAWLKRIFVYWSGSLGQVDHWPDCSGCRFISASQLFYRQIRRL